MAVAPRAPLPSAPGPRLRAPTREPSGTPRPAAPRPARARRRDVASQRFFLHWVWDVLARPQGQGQDSPGRVLVRLRHERPPVGHEQVLAIVGLAPAVEHRGLGIVPHAGPAELMDDGPARRDAVAVLGAWHGREHLPAHFPDERPERLLHVLHLLVLMVRPLPMEAQHRNTPTVHRAGIDLAVAVVVRDHLAATGESDRGAVVAAVVVLELLPVAAARRVAMDAAHEPVGRRVGAAPDLDVVTAREVELLVVQPPRHV